MIRCLITDGNLNSVAQWLERGLDYIQIRERNLCARALTELARKILWMASATPTRILVNDRADVALASGAHGVHLRDGGIHPTQMKKLGLIVSVSCHDPADVPNLHGADLILLAPVFNPLSKHPVANPLGLSGLKVAASKTSTPILALGGVTRFNENQCLEAGAAGIAGISYFRID